MVEGFEEVIVLVEAEGAVDEVEFFEDGFALLVFLEVVFEKAELPVLGDGQDCAVFQDHLSGFGVLFIVVEKVWELAVWCLQVDNLATDEYKITDSRLFLVLGLTS